MSAEDAPGGGHTRRRDRIAQPREDQLGLCRRHRVDETGPVPLAGQGAECEVRDQQHPTPRLRDREIHFTLGIWKDS